MTHEKATFILMVLDESGSMGPKRQDVIGGFNTFIHEQRQDPSPCRVSLVKFNTRHTQVFDAWTFVYIGASPDAWAQDMGLAAQNVAAFDANAPAASFRTLSESTLHYRRKTARASSDFLKKNGNGAN